MRKLVEGKMSADEVKRWPERIKTCLLKERLSKDNKNISKNEIKFAKNLESEKG